MASPGSLDHGCQFDVVTSCRLRGRSDQLGLVEGRCYENLWERIVEEQSNMRSVLRATAMGWEVNQLVRFYGGMPCRDP